jgi:DNA-binding MurR/RpiR family transcriptional regulator
VNSEVLDRITALLPTLSPSSRRVADAVTRDPARVAQLGIVELAELTGSSVGSINRFCHLLDLDGYTSLRMALAREVGHDSAVDPDFDPSGEIGPDLPVSETLSLLAASSVNALRRTAALLDEVALDQLADAVDGARQVQIFAFGGSAHIAQYLADELTGIGVLTHTTADVNTAVAHAVTLTEADIAVGISHSGTAKHAVDLLRLADERGAATAAVTSSANTPMARAADLVLATTARTASSRYRGTAGRHAQLFVTDALYVRVAQRRFDRAQAYLDRAGAATAQFQTKLHPRDTPPQ